MNNNFHCSRHAKFEPACADCKRLKAIREMDDDGEVPAPVFKTQPVPKPPKPAMTPHADITAKKHKGNPFSAEANPDADTKSNDMEIIYQGFVRRGADGAVREDVYVPLGYDSSTGSARCSDLAKTGRIVPVWNADGRHKRGRTRTGNSAGVWCADVYGKPRPIVEDEATDAENQLMPDVEQP